MLIKNKVLKIFYFLKKHFLMPLFTAVFIVTLSTTVLHIKSNEISINLQNILMYVSSYIFVYQTLKRVKKFTRLFAIISELLKTLLIGIVFIITLYSLDLLNNTGPIDNNNSNLIIIALFISTIIFGVNRYKIEEKIKAEKKIELRIHEQNVNTNNKYLLNKVSFLKVFSAPFINEGWVGSLGLLFILIIFTLFKLPFFNVSFTGLHQMKYALYVDMAKYMLYQHNPFLNQQKYIADIILRPDGVWSTFGSPPLIQWGLLTTYRFFPTNSLEFNTRLFMNFLGISSLISAYIFFKQIFIKIQSLLIVFLLAINPVYNFAYFATVEDSLLIIFTFLTLIYFNNFIERKRIIDLVTSGIILGVSILNKGTILIWLLPITLVLFLFKVRNIRNFIKTYGVFFFATLLPTLIFRTSLRHLPTNAYLSIILFIIWLFFLNKLYKLIIRHENKIDNLVELILKKRLILILSICFTLLLATIYIIVTQAYRHTSEFLTDGKLIFNWQMYNYMLNQEFKIYMTDCIYWLGLAGFVFTFIFSKIKEQRKVLLSFFFGAFIYWILMSKVIFFHNYYAVIIMIVFCLSVGTLFYLLSSIYKNKHISSILMILMCIAIAPTSYAANAATLIKEKNQENFQEMADYLNKNTKINDYYMDDTDILDLTIKTSRARIEPAELDNEIIKDSIKNIGFAETMNKYHIKYFITNDPVLPLDVFVNIFTDENLEQVNYRRSDIINSRLNPDIQYFTDDERRLELIKELNLVDKFVLEKQIGTYKFYTFKD